MANDRVILCGNVDRDNLPWDDPKTIHFRTSGPHWNIRPGLPRLTGLIRQVPDRFCDLLEIATYVYVADQVATRGGEGVDSVGEDWYRRLFFRIPVRNPDFWNTPQIQTALTKTLGFLSDDQYRFEFAPLVHPPQIQTYFDFGPEFSPLPYKPEIVMLFSGGLDSLAGAIQEAISNCRKVCMVMHRSTDKFITRHRRLHESLQERSAYPPLLFPVTINKKKNLNHEYTQRARSFLYVTLAAIYAEMFELPDIRFYENGVVSLNLPIADQAVGTRSTRTTHPQVLRGFSDVISLVAGRPLLVHNPFIWKTKRDIVEIIRDAGLSHLIQDSISCAHATWGVQEGKTHCGVCSQCIDRRTAILGAGLADADPMELYCRDVLTSPRTDDEHKLLIASYVATAEKVSEMRSPAEFFGDFGMACRAFEFFPDRSIDSVAQDIYDLHRRHANSVMQVLDEAIEANAKAIRRREHDPASLIRLISDSGDLDQATAAAAIVDAPLGENVFKKEGGGWRIRFAGGEPFIATPSKGMAYLYMLLSEANSSVWATELAKRTADRPETYQLGNAGEVLDEEGRTNYRDRLREINHKDLPQAKKKGDVPSQDKLMAERTWIEEELRRCGLHGDRREKDDRNRIRNQVAVAIKRAIEVQIRPYDPRLADHLQKPRLQKGYSLTYMPGDAIVWQFS